jgi:phosphopantothenoylcysteine decarboxylase
VEQGRRLTEDLLGAEPPLQPECSGGGRARPLGAMAASGASRKRIVLGITGSVAAVKGPRLALELCKAGCDVRIVLTARGEHFWKLAETYDPESWKAVSHVPGAVEPCSTEQLSSLLSSPAETCSVEAVLRDSDEWGAYHVVKKDPVLHIEVRLVCVCERERERDSSRVRPCASQLRRWATHLLIAPMSANTLGKFASGMCDDLLSCVFRAWDVSLPVIACPAMNTLMWEHPFTARDLASLGSLPCVRVVTPASATLACGDVGTGALAPVEDIVKAVIEIGPE